MLILILMTLSPASSVIDRLEAIQVAKQDRAPIAYSWVLAEGPSARHTFLAARFSGSARPGEPDIGSEKSSDTASRKPIFRSLGDAIVRSAPVSVFSALAPLAAARPLRKDTMAP